MDKTNLQGYEYEFVEKQSEDYSCLVCKCVARNPQQVNCCGKIICENCLERCKQTNSHHDKCPHCQQELTSFKDTRSHQVIISLRVRCSFTKHGCTWEGELKSYEKCHQHECSFQPTLCCNCGEQVPKQKLKRHSLDECRKRGVKCPYCPAFDAYDVIFEQHITICRYRPIECPSGCHQTIACYQIEQHKETCSFQIVRCCYHEIGCQVMVKRSELEIHEANCSMRHVSQQITRQTTIEESEKRTIAPIIIAFREFQAHSDKKSVWESQGFYTHDSGYRICLRVHPHGCSSGEGEYVSCYIHLKSGHFDAQLTWPFKGVVTVALRNQVEDYNHVEKKFKFLTCRCEVFNRMPKEESVNPLGIGDPQFICHRTLQKGDKNTQYLKDDELVFKISYELPPHNCSQHNIYHQFH